jgi:hypothetical protein
MKKIPPVTKYLGLLNNADSTGIASLILTFKKALGLFKKTAGCWSMSWSFKVLKNGLRFLSSWKVVLKTL